MKIIHQESFEYTYIISPYYSPQEIEFSEVFIVLDKIKSITTSDKYRDLWIVETGENKSYITKETLDKILANMEVI